MKLDFCENQLHVHFEVAEDGRVSLLHFSNVPFNEDTIAEGTKHWFPAVEVHLTGRDQDDHHGVKHTASSGSNSLKYREHQFYENDTGKKLEIVLQDEEMQVTVHYQFYTGVSAIRAWTTVTNLSKYALGLEYVSSFSLTGMGKEKVEDLSERLKLYIPHNSWCRELDWREQTLTEAGLKKNSRFATKRINISNTGTWSSKEYLPMAGLVDEEYRSAYLWQIENNGSWQWEISDISDYLYLKLSGPTENENQWHKELLPDETFESVKVAVAVGADFDGALGELTKYRRRIVTKHPVDAKLPVIFNDYMHCLWADPTTEKLLPVIDRAAEAGAEYYCMDAGWYADGFWWDTVGEWQPIPWRFPNGIVEVFDYIKSKGMVPGIWLEIESMGVNCPILEQFTDDCFFMRHGRRVIDHGRYQLDFRNEKVRKFATEVVDRVVTEYGVGYIKFDYNIEGGLGTEVDADSFGDGLLEYSRAFLTWLDEVLAKYPDLIMENCASGGMRMDYAMLQRLPIQSVTDMIEYQKMSSIAAVAATAVLPEQAAIWSYPRAHESNSAVAVNMINSMLLRMHLSGEITGLSEEQMAIVKEGVACYKQIRKDIASAVPFYPFGIENVNKDWLCTGYRCQHKQYLIIWRLNSKEKRKEIRLETGFSQVRIVYPSNNGCGVTCNKGKIEVMLTEQFSGVILELTK